MLDILGGIVKEVILSEATEHDRRVAEEHDAKNKKEIDGTKTRNSAITGVAGVAAVGALVAYGMSKLSDGNNNVTSTSKHKKA